MSSLSEIVFEVSEDGVDGGYSASAVGYGIHTEGETIDEVRSNVREAVECYFDEGEASRLTTMSTSKNYWRSWVCDS